MTHSLPSPFRHRVLIAAAVAALGITGVARAADPMTSATGGNLQSADRTFVEKATIGGMTEIQASKLAQQKGTSQAVKDYSAQMIADHTKAADELSRIATAKGVTPPGTLDKSHQGSIDKLAKLSGADFDKAYIKQMVSDHKTTVSDFQKEAKSGRDAELQAFASKTLPTLQGHLDMAQGDSKVSLK